MDFNNEVKDFKSERDKLTAEEIDKRIELARNYNKSLINNVDTDPYNRKKIEEGKKEYAKMLEVHEKIGYIEIPKIDTNLPIYAGTSPEVLETGAGHLEGTSLPIGGLSTHTVITAHSGLPKARLFSDLKDLQVGDKFYIHNIKELLAYRVYKIKVIEPSDFEDLLVVEGKDYATLLTCTPIMINTHRLLVMGERVAYNPNVDAKENQNNVLSYRYKMLFYTSIVIIFILLIIIRKIYIKKKIAEKALKNLKIKEEINDKTKEIK